MSTVSEYFGCMSFDDSTMKERLPKDTYKSLKKTIDEGRSLDINVANVVANAMKKTGLLTKGVLIIRTGSSLLPE